MLQSTQVCFQSNIQVSGDDRVKNVTCLINTPGAIPTTGSPGKIYVDFTQAQGVLIGFADYNCGWSCPTGLNPSWTLTATEPSGTLVPLTSANWQWSAATYQVDCVDTCNIKLYASDCDGYPTTQTQCHVAGGRGGGGANFCGSWSATKPVCPN